VCDRTAKVPLYGVKGAEGLQSERPPASLAGADTQLDKFHMASMFRKSVILIAQSLLSIKLEFADFRAARVIFAKVAVFSNDDPRQSIDVQSVRGPLTPNLNPAMKRSRKLSANVDKALNLDPRFSTPLLQPQLGLGVIEKILIFAHYSAPWRKATGVKPRLETGGKGLLPEPTNLCGNDHLENPS
jgi:hypothetical protein